MNHPTLSLPMGRIASSTIISRNLPPTNSKDSKGKRKGNPNILPKHLHPNAPVPIAVAGEKVKAATDLQG
jgi:hypothetical protein